jgi:hypothetical protein
MASNTVAAAGAAARAAANAAGSGTVRTSPQGDKTTTSSPKNLLSGER